MFWGIALLLILLLLIIIALMSRPKRKPRPQLKSSGAKQIYFAASLFTYQEVVGNELLARAIDTLSNGRYVCYLPQRSDSQNSHADRLTIRNEDLKHVLESDLVLINANGLDVDSGVVVEKMIAHVADKPVVMLRTDFRLPQEKWNLMLDFYPRTEDVLIDPIPKNIELVSNVSGLTNFVAQQVIAACDRVIQQPANLTGENYAVVTAWLRKMISITGPGDV
jgi:nucleoside 2-deoxyribosyltransferase